MQQIIGLLDAYAYQPMVWGVFVEAVRKPLSGQASDTAKIETGLAQARLCLRKLERLGAFEPFVLPSGLSLADLHAYPMLRCFSLARESTALLAETPRLSEWLKSMATLPIAIRTATVYEQTL